MHGLLLGFFTIIVNGPECALVDYLAEQARHAQEYRRMIAMEALQSIAMGRPDIPAVLSPGMPANVLMEDNSYVRSYAFGALGNLPDGAAIDFLGEVKRASLPLDSIWNSAQVALASARTLRLGSQQEQVRFLESLADGREKVSSPLVPIWASEQLCDRGMERAPQLLERALTSLSTVADRPQAHVTSAPHE